MPRSLRALRTALRRSCFGNDFAKAALMRRQRMEKSASPGRQRPDRVHVVRQHDESVDFEGILVARAGDRLAKRFDMVDEKRLPPLQQVDGEKPASARDEDAAIIRHDRKGIMCRR